MREKVGSTGNITGLISFDNNLSVTVISKYIGYKGILGAFDYHF
jgi:hypothetical protein